MINEAAFNSIKSILSVVNNNLSTKKITWPFAYRG